MATGFVLYAAAAARPSPLAALAGLTAAMVVYTAGELLHAPIATALALAQAPPALRGRYMAVNQMAWALAGALAPAVFTTLLRWHLLATPILLVALDTLAVAALTAMARTAPERPRAVPANSAACRPPSAPNPGAAPHPDRRPATAPPLQTACMKGTS
ncbi:MAG: hypothetical protein ACTHKG_10365 [Nocardioides sp.]